MARAATRQATTKPDFRATFDALKALLTPHASRLHVAKDTTDWYYLETKDPVFRGKPCMFAAVRLGKNYVSFYLMSVYMNKAQGAEMSAELKKHKQGKSCFNFTRPEPKLFAELRKFTDAGAETFRSGKFLEMVKSMTCD